MGLAEVRCVKGCTCGGIDLDGFWEEPFNIMMQNQLVVSASQECRLRIITHSVRLGFPWHSLRRRVPPVSICAWSE